VRLPGIHYRDSRRSTGAGRSAFLARLCRNAGINKRCGDQLGEGLRKKQSGAELPHDSAERRYGPGCKPPKDFVDNMKLYASSFRLGSHPENLQALFPRAARVGMITNALDFSTDLSRRQSSLQRECSDLESLGLVPDELDLRNYFGRQEGLADRLARCEGLWVVGGNAFILRRAMRYSGLDELLRKWPAHAGDFVYAGYSAGACVLAPTLKGIDLVDPPDVIPEGYASEIVWDGLGLLDYSIAPHFKSGHPDSVLVDAVVEYFNLHRMPYRALADGEAIVTVREEHDPGH
jgi:dipeptidase E